MAPRKHQGGKKQQLAPMTKSEKIHKRKLASETGPKVSEHYSLPMILFLLLQLQPPPLLLLLLLLLLVLLSHASSPYCYHNLTALTPYVPLVFAGARDC